MMTHLPVLCALFLLNPSPTVGLQLDLVQIRDVGQSAGGTPEEYCDAEEIVLNSPTSTNLDTGDRTIRFPNAKPGVDMLLTASDSYETNKPDKNGKQGEFGVINMKPGTAAEFTFTFVSTGTTSPVTIDKVSLSFFDQDEHKGGAGRSEIETCNVDTAFLAINTELSGSKNGNCYKTRSCEFGNKHNNPNDPKDLLDDHFKRATTFSYSQTSSITVKIDVAAAKGAGRNFQFSMDPVVACKKTTTTTTTQFDGFPSSCPNPSGAWKGCNCRQDPYCDTSFAGQAFWHHGFGVFRAAKTTTGDEIQGFQCPYGRYKQFVAIICGVAVKMGKNLITYIGSDLTRGDRPPLLTVNGKSESHDGKHRVSGGVVMPNNANIYQNDYSEVCIYDDARTFNVQMGLEHAKVFEINWKLHMADNVMDTSSPASCKDGSASFDTSSHVAKDRVDLKDSLFSMKEVDYICSNAFNVEWDPYDYYDDSKAHGSGCDFAAELEKWKHPVMSNQALCDATHTKFADAQSACSGIQRAEFLNACLFEYCNDKGAGDAAEVSNKIEEGLVKDEIDEIESHERVFFFLRNAAMTIPTAIRAFPLRHQRQRQHRSHRANPRNLR
jgi:hypothetical protein